MCGAYYGEVDWESIDGKIGEVMPMDSQRRQLNLGDNDSLLIRFSSKQKNTFPRKTSLRITQNTIDDRAINEKRLLHLRYLTRHGT